ncbi:MAG: DUF4230 domain-containing protein [Myxococcota bacterium]
MGVKGAVVGFVLGVSCAAGTWVALRAPPSPSWLAPDPPALVERMREVARLETLEVSLYRKVSFEPETPPPSTSTLRNIANWASATVAPERGRAIVFANAQLGLDLSRLDPSTMRVQGRRIDLVLPPIRTRVELRPGETEIIHSNLDSAHTAQMLEQARQAIENDVANDVALRRRAQQSAQRALTALLISLGFQEVRFVESLPPPAPTA